MRAIRGDQFGPEREHHRSLEVARMAGQPAATMRIGADQRTPRNVPIRSRGSANGVFEGDVSRCQLGQFVIATVTVQQKDAHKSVSHERLNQFVQDLVVCLGTQRHGSTENEVVM